MRISRKDHRVMSVLIASERQCCQRRHTCWRQAIILAVRVSRIILVISILLLTSRGATAQGITGHVTSSSGEPVAGVTVWDFPWDKATTDTQGRFSLNARDSKIRFQMNGYSPLTTFINQGSSVSVVMEKATDALWTPPVCKLTPEWFHGEQMAFRSAKHANIKRSFDVDYGIVRVRYKKNALWIGYGGTWSWGYPPDDFFQNLSELHERDVEYILDVPTAEYRGKRTDGTYFRFIGKFMETIQYDHATKEQADYFDAIMDTLCWVHDPYGK
jgi:hypothetical protein